MSAPPGRLPFRLVYPAGQMRVVLAECRRRGLPFDAAWKIALESLPRGTQVATKMEAADWRQTLADTREFYARAYRGDHVFSPETAEALAAVTQLAEDTGAGELVAA